MRVSQTCKMRFGVSCVCVLVVLGQVRSQNDAFDLARGGSFSGPPAVHIGGPPSRFINGPTGFSVEGEHHRDAGVRDFVNGPTATSVDVLEDRPQSTFMSGPTGISLFTEERRAEEEEQSLNVSMGEGKTIADQEDRAAGATAVADGPTMSSVEEERPGLQGGQEEDGGRSSNRGIMNTNPQEGSEVKQVLPPGFHIDTADGSRDTDDWMYTGGEWARVNLPDANHPDIPAPTIPGPALVVVTKDYLKKVTVTRDFVGLTNVTLHYRFFLSVGVGMHGVPELKVYLVVGDTSIPLAAETSRGDWSDSTLKVPVSPDSESFKIVFEARLMKEGNEISLDDITISGISGNQFGGQDNSSANSTHLPDDATVPVPIAETHPQDTANHTLLSEDDNLTDNKTSISLDEADMTQDEESTVSEIVTPPTNTENVDEEVSEKTEITQDNVNTEIPVVSNNKSVVDNVVNLETDNTSSVEWEEETVQLKAEGELNGKKKIEKLEIQTNADKSKGKQEILKSTTDSETLNDESIGNYNDKLDDGENETFVFPSPTYSNTTAEESVTLAETNLTDENNQTQDNPEATSATSNTNESMNDNVTSSHMPSQPPTLDNKTQSVDLTDTPDVENSTFIPSQSEQTSEEMSLAPSTSLNNTTTIDISGGPESSSVTSTSDHNSMSPSGAVIPTVTTNTTGTDSPVMMPDESATTSWRVFQVFLVLCLLGLLGLGFLYWKKKRKQEDEIPVFTRPSHTDYHNPTFNMDDDASFVSRGGRHNYKSFE